MSKKIMSGTLAALGILVLILDSKTAISGVQNAVNLCLASVIPSIFPFIVLSGMLVSVLNGLHTRILRPVSSLLKISPGTEGIFLAGILGGYPIGAQCVHQAWKDGHITRKNAERLLMFCSNAGPSFLFGILGTKFSSAYAPWTLWVIHILAAICVARIIPAPTELQRSTLESKAITMPQALRNGVITMGYICGWIVLFRMILSFLDRWFLWLLPAGLRVCIYGILELANGCLTIDAISLPGQRFVITSGILAFGGLCVAMQTASVTGPLGIKSYIFGKILQTIISIVLSILAQYILFPPADRLHIPLAFTAFLVGISALFYLLLRKTENKGSIPRIIGV